MIRASFWQYQNETLIIIAISCIQLELSNVQLEPELPMPHDYVTRVVIMA